MTGAPCVYADQLGDLESRATEISRAGRVREAVTAWQTAYDEARNPARVSINLAPDDTAVFRTGIRLVEAWNAFGAPESALPILNFLQKGRGNSGVRTRGVSLQSNLEFWPSTSDNVAAFHYALGMTQQKLGKFQDALRSYAMADSSLVAAGESQAPARAVVLRGRAEVHRILGQYDSAVILLEASLLLRRGSAVDNAAFLAPALRSLGQIAIERWDLVSADRYLSQALSLDSTAYPNGHAVLATDFEALAILAWRRGDYRRALEMFERTMRMREVVLPPTHLELAWAYANMAEFLLDIGRTAKAVEYDEKALAVMKLALGRDFGRGHIDVAQVRFNMAKARAAQGDVEPALEDMEFALEKFQNVFGRTHAWTLETMEERAMLLARLGRMDHALAAARSALELREQAYGADHPMTGRALRIVANLARRAGKPGEAVALADRSLDILKRALGAVHPEVARSLWEKAIAQAGVAENPTAGMAAWNEYSSMMEKILCDLQGEDGWRYEEYQRNVAEWNERLVAAARRNPELALGIIAQEARDRTIQLRAGEPRSGTEIGAVSSRVLDARYAAERAEEELDKRRREGGLSPDCEAGLTSTAQTRWLVYSRLREAELRNTDPRAFQNIRFASSKRLSEGLKVNEYLLQIYSGESRAIVILVSSGTRSILFYDTTALGRAEMRREVETLRQLVTRPAQGDSDELRRLAETTEEFYARLFGLEIGECLARADTVHVIPDGALFYLPFEVLDATPNGRYEPWGLRTTISYIANPSLLASVSTSLVEPVSGALLYANPTPAARGYGQLVGAEAEAELIAGEVSSATIRRNRDATEARLVSDLARMSPEILVFSAHASAAPMAMTRATNEYPQEGTRQLYFSENSAIFLAPDTAAEADGELTIADVENLESKRFPRLVVLSACQTALGEVSEGGEVINLAEAFRIQGAENVVATLWSIDDFSSVHLTYDFFRHLAEGHPRAESLRLAKKTLWDTEPRYRHPFYWAGYVIFEGMR